MDSLRRGHPGAGACARWHLVFGSARDTTCRHWSRAAGAETVMPVLNQTLIEGERSPRRGESISQDCSPASGVRFGFRTTRIAGDSINCTHDGAIALLMTAAHLLH